MTDIISLFDEYKDRNDDTDKIFFIKKLRNGNYIYTVNTIEPYRTTSPWYYAQAINALIKKDINHLTFIMKLKHEIMGCSPDLIIKTYNKNRFAQMYDPIPLNKLIPLILNGTTVKDWNDTPIHILTTISKTSKITFILITNILKINAHFNITRLLYKKNIIYRSGIDKQMLANTDTISLIKSDKANQTIDVIGDDKSKKIIILETIDGINYTELRNIYNDIEQAPTNLNWSILMDTKNSLMRETIVNDIIPYEHKRNKDICNIDYGVITKYIVDYCIANKAEIRKRGESDITFIILYLLVDYISDNINKTINKSELKTSLLMELYTIKTVLESKVIPMMRSIRSDPEISVLMYDELYNMFKKLNIFNDISIKEQFFTKYIS